MKYSNRITSKGKVAVVIPSYKAKMSKFEFMSYMQCLKILGKYDIFIAGPEGLDISEYKKYRSVIHYKQDPKFFVDTLSYSKLMLSPFFYEGLAGYDYILIYQLDCYVFRDELEKWCNDGFDYVAPPWVKQDLVQWVLRKKRNYPVDLKLLHRITRFKLLGEVGNGGFSLRKTDTMIRNLNFFSLRLRYYNGNEDVFISHFLGSFNPFFRIPDTSTALQFGFDAHPDTAYQMNGEKLPFGCHGWWRNDRGTYDNNRDFWMTYIDLNSIEDNV